MVMQDREKNPHANHRERMRERFMRYGLDSFEDHSILELLLFYAQPRKDTNVTAHRLLEAFGSLEGVFEATPEALKTVEGIGDNAAVLIHLVPEVARRYFIAKAGPGTILNDSEAVGRYLLPRFLTFREERMYMVCMDAKLKVLDCREVGRGGTISVGVNIRGIVQLALSQNATYAVLAHNHTSGLAIPSKEDVTVTLRVRQVLAEVGVTLTDHIVIGDDDFVSMADSGYLSGL